MDNTIKNHDADIAFMNKLLEESGVNKHFAIDFRKKPLPDLQILIKEVAETKESIEMAILINKKHRYKYFDRHFKKNIKEKLLQRLDLLNNLDRWYKEMIDREPLSKAS